MKPKILLVNPWICDFAAYNLWARPLGLLQVAERFSAFDIGLSLIDCTDSVIARQHGAGRFRREKVEKPELVKNIPRVYKRYGISVDEFVQRVKKLRPFDLVMMTSIMSYWYPGIQQAIRGIRATVGNVPIILGGIYATLYHEHAFRNTGADYIHRGPLEKNLNRMLNNFGLQVTEERRPIPYYRLGLYNDYPFAPLLTASGCPFKCSYCATGLLVNGYQRRSTIDIAKEVRELYMLGIRDFAFYDDALLVDPEAHIKPTLRKVIQQGLHIRFHTPNGLHARFIDSELARLMKESGFETIRLSLETVNEARQKGTGGKVSNEDLDRAVAHLKKQGFTKKEIGVYLMYGLPGQEMKEVKEGITFLKTLGVRINLTEFSPIRGTQCWSELVQQGIIDDNLDPLLTNNSIFAYLYSEYDPGEIRKMKLDVKEYNAA